MFPFWEDKQIATGEDWLREIESALTKARAAVLLISVDFLNSGFIKASEVPRLLARREREGLRIFPVLARPCNWKLYDWLQRLQLWPRNARALSGMDEHTREESLAALVAEIQRQLSAAGPAVRVRSSTGPLDETEHILVAEIDKELLATSANIGASSCSLFVADLDAHRKYLQIKSAYGPGSEKVAGLRIPSNHGIAGLVFTHGIPHLTNKLANDAKFAPSIARKADLTPRSMVAVPIKGGDGDVLGLAQFINKESGPFVDSDQVVAMEFAEKIGPLLEKLLQRPVDDRVFEGIRECSIIFTDITNYGRMADSAQLLLTSRFLNEYLTMVCDVALEFGFWIDKFLGDGVMLVGNAPRQRANYAFDSVSLAFQIEKRMGNLIEEWKRFGLDAPIANLRSRIGIATGRVYLGTLGHPQVHWYTAVGPSVNLAWRLLQLASRDEDCIMICPHTFQITSNRFRADRVDLGYKDASIEPGIGYRVREILDS